MDQAGSVSAIVHSSEEQQSYQRDMNKFMETTRSQSGWSAEDFNEEPLVDKASKFFKKLWGKR